MADILDEHGYEVVHAGNGEKAIDLLRDGLRPGLILLDLMMPVMDGRQFRVEQRKDLALADIPVVILSAAGNLQKHTRSLDASLVVAKPVAPENLLAIVARYLP